MSVINLSTKVREPDDAGSQAIALRGTANELSRLLVASAEKMTDKDARLGVAAELDAQAKALMDRRSLVSLACLLGGRANVIRHARAELESEDRAHWCAIEAAILPHAEQALYDAIYPNGSHNKGGVRLERTGRSGFHVEPIAPGMYLGNVTAVEKVASLGWDDFTARVARRFWITIGDGFQFGTIKIPELGDGDLSIAEFERLPPVVLQIEPSEREEAFDQGVREAKQEMLGAGEW